MPAGQAEHLHDLNQWAGSGQGVVGLAAAMCGAHRVILTDVAPALPGIQHNIVLNNVEVCYLARTSVMPPSAVSNPKPKPCILNLNPVPKP